MIPARSQFDFFGIFGASDGAALTGIPASIDLRMDNGAGPPGAYRSMLATSGMTLTRSGPDTFTNAPATYDLTVKITNSTTHTMSPGGTKQVVLYDQAGSVVGGETRSSDNVPASLPPGMSYREGWTGIPAWENASRAVYTVW